MYILNKVAIIFLTSLILISCSDTSAETVNNSDFFVGYKKIMVESKETGDEFPLTIVYPTNTKSKPVKFGPFQMNLSIGARIANKKFPLVIISHGSGGSNWGHRSIAFDLAKKGYIVGLPLHPRNNYRDNSDEGTNNNWLNRPKHIKSAIDSILSNVEFFNNIEKNKIAVVGHSAGGYTALALAGGIGNSEHIINLCKEKPKINQNFCSLAKSNSTKPIELKGLSDSRVKAIVLMAPVGLLFQSDDALKQVKIPVFLMRAEKDKELVEPYHSELIAKKIRKQLLSYQIIPNAGHFSFITPFPEVLKSKLGDVADDPEGFDRVAFHKQLGNSIATYLGKVLK